MKIFSNWVRIFYNQNQVNHFQQYQKDFDTIQNLYQDENGVWRFDGGTFAQALEISNIIEKYDINLNDKFDYKTKLSLLEEKSNEYWYIIDLFSFCNGI